MAKVKWGNVLALVVICGIVLFSLFVSFTADDHIRNDNCVIIDEFGNEQGCDKNG